MEVKFSTIKKGTLFNFPNRKKLYEFLGGGKKKGWSYRANDDINAHYTTKTDRAIIT